MDGTAVKALEEAFRSPQIVGEGFIATPINWTVKDQASFITPGPTAEALGVYTLGALRDYITANRDALDRTTLVVHVVSPQVVRLVGPLQARARNREAYVQAQATNLTDGFLGKFMAIDEFIVGLQTRFADEHGRADVLKLFGNVKHEGVKTLADDGVTQTVTAKAGVVLANEVAVPNPVTLTPFRTFREVLQPASPFALRVTGATSGTLTVGLFEADGGAWRITAVERIRGWLEAELTGNDVAVLA